MTERWEEIYNGLIDECGVNYKDRRRIVGPDAAQQEEDDAVIEMACKRIAELEAVVTKVRHENAQMVDAAWELSNGHFSRRVCFWVQDPGDPTKRVALDPSEVVGLYEEFRRKLVELGDWSSLRDGESELAKSAARIAELEAMIAKRDRRIADVLAVFWDGDIIERPHDAGISQRMLDALAALESVTRSVEEA